MIGGHFRLVALAVPNNRNPLTGFFMLDEARNLRAHHHAAAHFDDAVAGTLPHLAGSKAGIAERADERLDDIAVPGCAPQTQAGNDRLV